MKCVQNLIHICMQIVSPELHASTDVHASPRVGGHYTHLQSRAKIITKRRPLTDSPTLCKNKNDKATETGLDVSFSQLSPQLSTSDMTQHVDQDLSEPAQALDWAWAMAVHAHCMHQTVDLLIKNIDISSKCNISKDFVTKSNPALKKDYNNFNWVFIIIWPIFLVPFWKKC